MKHYKSTHLLLLLLLGDLLDLFHDIHSVLVDHAERFFQLLQLLDLVLGASDAVVFVPPGLGTGRHGAGELISGEKAINKWNFPVENSQKLAAKTRQRVLIRSDGDLKERTSV